METCQSNPSGIHVELEGRNTELDEVADIGIYSASPVTVSIARASHVSTETQSRCLCDTTIVDPDSRGRTEGVFQVHDVRSLTEYLL